MVGKSSIVIVGIGPGRNFFAEQLALQACIQAQPVIETAGLLLKEKPERTWNRPPKVLGKAQARSRGR